MQYHSRSTLRASGRMRPWFDIWYRRYIYCLLVYIACFPSDPFSSLFLTCLLPYLSFPSRIDPLRFQAACRKRRLNLALVLCLFLCWLVNACFCCVRFSFYRAMLCIRGTSHRPVSVCVCPSVSVTSRSSTKTAKRRITQTTPRDTPRDSSFLTPKISAKFDRGHPLRGRRMQVGWSKSATFDK